MHTTLGVFARRLAPGRPAWRLLALAVILLAPTGCATSDADLDYTRQPAPDTSSGDNSFHGWNNVNYDKQQ